MMNIPLDDMKFCIQEWFSQEQTLVGVSKLYCELNMELERQLKFMLNEIAKEMDKENLEE